MIQGYDRKTGEPIVASPEKEAELQKLVEAIDWAFPDETDGHAAFFRKKEDGAIESSKTPFDEQ